MSKYIAANTRKITITENSKINDQIVLSGIDESYYVSKGTVLVDFIACPGTGVITLNDGKGNLVATGVNYFANDHAPLRCDYGVIITGQVSMLKGTVLRNVFDA